MAESWVLGRHREVQPVSRGLARLRQMGVSRREPTGHGPNVSRKPARGPAPARRGGRAGPGHVDPGQGARRAPPALALDWAPPPQVTRCSPRSPSPSRWACRPRVRHGLADLGPIATPTSSTLQAAPAATATTPPTPPGPSGETPLVAETVSAAPQETPSGGDPQDRVLVLATAPGLVVTDANAEPVDVVVTEPAAECVDVAGCEAGWARRPARRVLRPDVT